MRALLGIAVVVMCAAAPLLSPAQDQQATEKELARLQDAIAELQRTQARQIERRDDGMSALRDIELSLTESRRALAGLDQSIREQTTRLDQIVSEQADASARLSGEQGALAEQVRMSYMAGRQEFVRVLLSQDKPADFGRMLVYYDYLNRHRSEQIEAVGSKLAVLAELAAENAAATARLESLRSDQASQLQELEQQQEQRRELLTVVEAEIASSGSRLEQLLAQEAELNDILTRLNQVIEGFPVNTDAPFAALKGQLAPPIQGQHLARFGDPRDSTGEVRWEAVLLGAEAGTVVRAVYQGRVAYAQWQPHLGLLLMIDHGDGYKSIYGHNGALLRGVGEWVGAGDAIAEVGNTGGQAEPALYFGIVRGVEAEDPDAWLK